MQLYAMNMNLMAEKIFVVVEFGFKENVIGAIVVHNKAFLFYLYALFRCYNFNVLNKHE